MGTHAIPDKVMAKVERIFTGSARKRAIEALESGKTVYSGGTKLRGVKVDKADEGSEKSAPAAPTKPPAAAEVKKPGTGTDK